jgi:GNAT superfamily N-acetyltransferase
MEPLEDAANREAQTMLGVLSREEQRALVSAMDTIERLLGEHPNKRAAYVIRQHEPGDIGWLISRHGAIYAQEYGLNSNFEALVAEVSAAFLRNHDARRERCWIAEMDGNRIGSIMLCRESDEVAKLRVLLVEPAARGLGVGRRLVEECLRFAKQAGYRKVVLWTANVLSAARRIYEAAGFRLVREEPHRMFGPEWVGEHWELEL